MNLDEKSIAVINILKGNETWTTCSTISESLQLPQRSVRYIISKINKQKNIIASSNKGYLLLEDFETDYSSDIPYNLEERKKYLLHQLVILNKVLNIDDLAEHLHISLSTLKNSLPDLKKELGEQSLYLKTKQNKLFVIGKERDKQKYAVKLIKNEVEKSSFSLSNIQQFFRMVNLEDIKNLVIAVSSKYQYFLNDYSLLNYVIHLAVCIELHDSDSQKHNAGKSINQQQIATNDEVIMIVKEITEHINIMYSITLTVEDVIEASILMTTRIVSKQNDIIDLENMGQVVGDDVRDLISEIMSSVYDKYSIDLSNQQLIIRFALHLKNLLLRVRNNIPIQNAQFVNIKNEYPFLYDLAAFVSYIINKRMGCVLPEDEIAYIALHIGVMIEQNTIFQEKLTCVIVSTDYHTIGKILFKKISSIFSQTLFIQNLVTISENYNDLSSDVDLIISTYPLINTKIPCIVVGPFLNDSDIAEVSSKIEKIKQAKRKNHILSKIELFLKDDVCFFNKNFNTAEDAIEGICNFMMEKGYVEETFKEEIYAHENIAPSSYGNFAIAHTFSHSPLPSTIAISVNPNPISWGDNKVNIVFIISLNKKDNKLFKDIFKFMADIITNKQALPRILKTTSYEELIEVIRYYI